GCQHPAAANGSDEAATGVVRREGSETNEVTTHYRDGRYRVTRCDPDGSLIVSQYVAPIRVPGGGSVPARLSETRPDGDDVLATVHLEYGDAAEPVFAERWRKYGGRDREAVIPPTKPADATSVSPASARAAAVTAGTECSDGSYTFLGGHWGPLYVYYVYFASLPGDV